ncbi:hypothetical protein, partial [Pseudomonas syringae]|uniref:hypothetical protein n=1 Tax=Pseudomonas syringae TaxID=317 RepID=UPI0024E15A57
DDELADIKLEGCIEFSVFLGHDDSSMGVVSPIEVSGVIRPAHCGGELARESGVTLSINHRQPCRPLREQAHSHMSVVIML